MPDISVRDIHDAVARSQDPVVASTRPAGTTSTEMRRMVRDVIDKLRPAGVTVLEIGCGTGVLAVPVAALAASYTGVDLSPRAVEVLRARVPHATLRCADITQDDLGDLGNFDRVLVYATLHYVTTEDEGARFLRNALARLAPGGLALFGNLPLPAADLPHTPRQRVLGAAWSVRRRLSRQPRRPAPPPLPPGSCLPLSLDLVEEWLGAVDGIRWRWLAPAAGVPMQRTRADLVVERTGATGSR